MSRAGGIAYLLKHGRAAMPTVTRTEMPRAKGVKRMAGGGAAPANAPLNYGNVPNYEYSPSSQNLAPHYELGPDGVMRYVPGRYFSGVYGGGTGSGGSGAGGAGAGAGAGGAGDLNALNRDATSRDYGGVGSEGVANNTGWGSMTPAEQAGFMSNNPNIAALSQTGLTLFGLTSLGKMSQALNPQAWGRAESINLGINPEIAETAYGQDQQNQRGQEAQAQQAQQQAQQQSQQNQQNDDTVDVDVDTDVDTTNDVDVADEGTDVSVDVNAGTDAGGGGGGSGGCFLTTAAVDHMGQEDSGDVLNTLRRFRDTYMLRNKDQSKDVAWYYKNAPKIVEALNEADDGGAAYKQMYEKYILPAYEAIKSDEPEKAYEIYKNGINYAVKAAGLSKKDLTPRSGSNGISDLAAKDAVRASAVDTAEHTPAYATGGIAALAGGGQPGQPRLLSGGGTGLSDDIPAVIGHNRPARLADGEFVVSADVVSALGGGSTKAGAKKLYAMMDRIRQNAHGTKKQIKKLNDRKVLPA